MSEPALNLLVVRAIDLERTKQFYTALGLRFINERHGRGPEHFASNLGDVVFEIYLRGEDRTFPDDTRLGFNVASLESALHAITVFHTKLIVPPAESPWGRRAIVCDPDGRKVELTEDQDQRENPIVKEPIVGEGDSLTFSDYFKLSADLEEVLAHLGYSSETKMCDLPASKQVLAGVDVLQAKLTRVVPHISLTSEAAKREFLIAPVLMDVVEHTGGRVKIEYPVNVSPQLQGTLDYFVQAENNLPVIEAKSGDLSRGFLQLAVELVALDHWLDPGTRPLYGAISTGDVWRFGILDRAAKRVTQDLNLYRVPADLDPLLHILVGILTGK
jgi:catechol 2,3-dioxygenase-like lactoylglutathione lyase family enzyme